MVALVQIFSSRIAWRKYFPFASIQFYEYFTAMLKTMLLCAFNSFSNITTEWKSFRQLCAINDKLYHGQVILIHWHWNWQNATASKTYAAYFMQKLFWLLWKQYEFVYFNNFNLFNEFVHEKSLSCESFEIFSTLFRCIHSPSQILVGVPLLGWSVIARFTLIFNTK